MEKANIGIVGYGFVGKAVAHGFQACNLVIADPLLGTSTDDMLDKKFDAIFICVPTPMGDNGVIDASIVKDVMRRLAHVDTILVLKSTVTPDQVDKLAWWHPNFVYNPEFLTERNALRDFEYPIMHVFGGAPNMTLALEMIYTNCSICDNNVRCFHMTAKEASFVKYTMNSFLTTKVLFFNQIAELCSKHGADYNTVIKAVTTDDRIAPGHTNVPGNDGRLGAAGACFAKDVPAFIRFSNNSLSILREVWNANCDIRNQYPDTLAREKAQHITFEKI